MGFTMASTVSRQSGGSDSATLESRLTEVFADGSFAEDKDHPTTLTATLYAILIGYGPGS